MRSESGYLCLTAIFLAKKSIICIVVCGLLFHPADISMPIIGLGQHSLLASDYIFSLGLLSEQPLLPRHLAKYSFFSFFFSSLLNASQSCHHIIMVRINQLFVLSLFLTSFRNFLFSFVVIYNG